MKNNIHIELQTFKDDFCESVNGALSDINEKEIKSALMFARSGGHGPINLDEVRGAPSPGEGAQ